MIRSSVLLLAAAAATAVMAMSNGVVTNGDAYWMSLCVKGRSCGWGKMYENGTWSSKDFIDKNYHYNTADNTALYQKRNYLLYPALIDSLFFVVDLTSKAQYWISGFNSTQNSQTAGFVVDQSIGIGYFIVTRYTGQYELWTIDLNAPPPAFKIQKLFAFDTPDGTNLCYSVVLGPKGKLYAFGMVDYVQPYYIFEIDIATGKLRSAPIECDDYIPMGAACVNVFGWDTSAAGKGSFVFYTAQIVPAIFLRTFVDFEQQTGKCSVIYQWNNTQYFADRGAGLFIGNGNQPTYLYTVLAGDGPIPPAAPTATATRGVIEGARHHRVTGGDERPIVAYRVDAALGQVNQSWVLDGTDVNVDGIMPKEYQLATN